jgi:hypothetical protein
MTTDFERLRADVKALRDEPGRITKAEVDELLRRHPAAPPPAPADAYADEHYDPTHYA